MQTELIIPTALQTGHAGYRQHLEEHGIPSVHAAILEEKVECHPKLFSDQTQYSEIVKSAIRETKPSTTRTD